MQLVVAWPRVSDREGPAGVARLAKAMKAIGYDPLDMFDHVGMGRRNRDGALRARFCLGRGRVPTHQAPSTPSPDEVLVVQLESDNRCPARWRQPLNLHPTCAPLKMITPVLLAGVE